MFDDALLVGVLNDFHRPWSLSNHRLTFSSQHANVRFPNDLFCIIPYGVNHLDTHAFLHRLIQELLKRNLGVHALQLAFAYESLPHFHRVLEWLLHEVLESEATSKSPIPDPLLPQVVAFIQEFPHFLETVAQCARKTEVARWPHLFTAVGRRPKDLFELCVDCGNLPAAAAYLIILQSCEPIGVSQKCTLHLLQAALQASRWSLIRDMLRFLNAIDPNDLRCDQSTSSKSTDKTTESRSDTQSSKINKQLTSMEATVEMRNSISVQSRRSSTFKSSSTLPTVDNSGPIAEPITHRSRLPSKSDGDGIPNPAAGGGQSLPDLIKQVFKRTATDWCDAVRQQLIYLLNQLLQAGSFEWASLVALMILDRTGLFHAITLAVDAATQCTLQRLRQQPSSGLSNTTVPADSGPGPRPSVSRAANLWRRVTGHHQQQQPTTQSGTDADDPEHNSSQSSPIFGDPLSRVFAGLHQLNSWSVTNCPTYHRFIGLLQPELDQLIEQATSFFGQCVFASQLQSTSAPLSSPTSVAYVQLDSTTPELTIHASNMPNGFVDEPVARIEQVQLVSCTKNTPSDFDGSEKSRSESQIYQYEIPFTGVESVESVQSSHRPSKMGVVVHSLDSSNSLLSVGLLTLSPPDSPGLCDTRRTASEDWTESAKALNHQNRNFTNSMHTMSVNPDVIYADDHLIDGTSEVHLQHTPASGYSCILS
ncbi:unnamed protein product [Echinostoma caproni]|uniref:Protein RIC1 homolog n=1 Tax=Echinostoma caproni TaxID=27848 RepID=A0A3P8FZ11_9TREM|nr:unnamed protein product [Echinostoma caproni]